MKTKTKRTVDMRDPYSGQRVRVSNLDEAQASLLRAKVRVKKAEVKHGLASPSELREAQAAQSKMTLREAIERRCFRIKKSTAALHKSLLKNHLAAIADTRLNDLTAERVWRWWESLDRMRFRCRTKAMRLPTKARTLQLLASTVKATRKEGLCVTTTDGWPNWRGLVETKTYDPEKRAALSSPHEVLQLLKAAFEWDKKHGAVAALTIIVLLETGMRQGEAAALRCDDVFVVPRPSIDGETAEFDYEIRVNKQLLPRRIGGGIGPIKTARSGEAWPERKPRPRVESDLGRLAIAELLRTAKEWGQETLFFARIHGGQARTTPEVLQPKTMRAIWSAAGLPDADKAVTHSLRHSQVLLNLKASGNIHTAQQAVGHASVKTTAHYLDAIVRPRTASSASLNAVDMGVQRTRPPLLAESNGARVVQVSEHGAPLKRDSELDWFWAVFARWDGQSQPDEISAWVRSGAEAARKEAKGKGGSNPAQKARQAADTRRHRWNRFARSAEAEFQAAWPTKPERASEALIFEAWAQWAERRATRGNAD